MKKFFTLIVAMFMMFGMATAQTTVNEGVFSHMYIGINGGVNQTTVSDYSNWDNGFTNGLKTLTYNASVELGKDVTPITGFSLQAGVSPIYHNVDNNGSGEWKINRTDLFGNVKFNLMNLFSSYKGYPRRVEIKTVTGIGWNCNISDENKLENDFGLQAGLEFDFNLGKNRNWFITFSPMVQANNLLKGRDEIQWAAEDADLRANVGVAYRFGRGNQNHSFKICDKTYTEEQYAELYAIYDDCMSTANRVDTVVEKVVEVVEKVVEVNNNNTIITFAKNSSEITEIEMQRINIFMENVEKDANIKVIGSADTKTGTEEYNNNLANKRAESVKAILESNGYTNITIEATLDAYNTVELSRCAKVVCE